MDIKKLITSLLLIGFFSIANADNIPSSPRAEQSIKLVESLLKRQLKEKGLEYGSPIFIRIFKQDNRLELWVKKNNGTFHHFKNYKICAYSGKLGPKLKQGDLQSPEGFYYVTPGRLNPWSSYHLSFNLGYPNQYDKAHGRTGNALMVHGRCVSIGCYAMNDRNISEIYTLAVAAFQSGQPFFRVHAFPFELKEKNLKKHKSNRWYSFWKNLQEGYDYFEENRKPPNIIVHNGKYIIDKN